MYISIPLLALFATSHAYTHILPLQARRHNEDNIAAGIEKACRRIEALTKLHDIANNQTALDDMLADSRLAQARIDWIKNKSAETTLELDTLSANTTLTAECDAIRAQRDAAMECRKLEQLETLVDLANKPTPLAAHTAADLLTQGRKDGLQQKLEKAELKLQALRSNSTLMELCASDVGPTPEGAISNQEVDNSGAISLTKSGAVTYKAVSRATSSLMAMILSASILALQ